VLWLDAAWEFWFCETVDGPIHLNISANPTHNGNFGAAHHKLPEIQSMQLHARIMVRGQRPQLQVDV